jgi:hypothetical protein
MNHPFPIPESPAAEIITKGEGLLEKARALGSCIVSRVGRALRTESSATESSPPWQSLEWDQDPAPPPRSSA